MVYVRQEMSLKKIYDGVKKTCLIWVTRVIKRKRRTFNKEGEYDQKYHNHKLQTNPWRRKEEQHNNQEKHEDKLTKATSSSLPIKMIAKTKWTQSIAQQNTDQLQNPTTGATHCSQFVATSVKTMVVCYLNSLSCDL